ncbi:L-seryl-tRNA(Sec) selenium transferase [Campylobacter sp. JMF_04 NA10]|uniref:L-seryl-tRNA(Sec) selenium transferase n=1 Tax=Campylobacter sp. JMF_04 NA10 TaxID=2983824 RepID=UPI0022E9D22F|nr:L-seryl-tRNA(Sec) selenium transferase [Campylobacter sp. JMF_04 NA10]MDA3076168.1 L-seryl-tRNA(Sec) selenium transferase [Campylobacter sp. JMF_04 NA10]
MQIKLPKVDKIANSAEFHGLLKPVILRIAKEVINEFRTSLVNGENSCASEEQIIAQIKSRYEKFANLALRPLINATGVVLHTNLGRSVISPEILSRAQGAICAYSNLEFDLDSGTRSNRYDYTSALLAELFGCESALVVNNNAAAVFLVLNTFARGREVVVSRGELVEIGGSFRVSEVMANSGAILREIGTTNKTKISDYQNAINENTAVLMKIHRSNFEISGFTQSVEIGEISRLAKFASEKKAEFYEKKELEFKICEEEKFSEIIDYYDLGSGSVNDLGANLTKNEPKIGEILASGARLISFSGDKLFGSVQCGIILGEKSLIQKLRKNQLLRMLRADKITLAILNETIKAYINKEFSLIPTIDQIHLPLSELERRAQGVLDALKNTKFQASLIRTKTFVGGGSLPCKNYDSVALVLSQNASPEEISAKFRARGIIGRIENDKFLLDFRAILKHDLQKLIKILKEMYE